MLMKTKAGSFGNRGAHQEDLCSSSAPHPPGLLLLVVVRVVVLVVVAVLGLGLG